MLRQSMAHRALLPRPHHSPHHASPRSRTAPISLLTLPRSCFATRTLLQEGQKDGHALRTAEAREAALRAARLRRHGEREERERQEAQRREQKRAYEARYKSAGRRWVSTIIALPILLVTSWYLFDRLVLGHAAKELPRMKDDQETGHKR
ncbi:hypothetical protein ESCO_006631 [Escovopsis weberi]|uniref:Uncharacterized protein n=1 Tax=Escovopsis weberi TaxID=150374 RepID=A0A0M8N4Y7_ESCWE|nr:hypothetical protein ESCO_006631 [Escovopsis weberi]